ncbi:probable G-protein coupled receptor 139 [Heptranchias perlo]|uniref:probable G-protein coupled receptor 139 n=1 Tax=Heptranchias perlo TaxID=212740 RepID=UPI00355971B2
MDEEKRWPYLLSLRFDSLLLLLPDTGHLSACTIASTCGANDLGLRPVLVNLLTIVILSRGKCGLSKCVTLYLVAMAAGDLLVVITDLILRQIPIVFYIYFYFLWSIPVCNIHAVLLFAATDCSVWFTVSFTFDRFVAICCQKLKTKYCSERTASVVLGTVTVLSCLKSIPWYFMFTRWYTLINEPWFCAVTPSVMISPIWGVFELLHNILTPCVPFILVLLLNAFTVRHIFEANRARRRLRGHSSGESPSDPEMESRRKSIILLFVISGNFILLWALFMVYSMWNRMLWLGFRSVILPNVIQEMGFMLQLLSCCTNTCIYAVTQTKFREQLKNVVKYPFTVIVKFIK